MTDLEVVEVPATTIEVVEVGAPQAVTLAFDPYDLFDGAEVVSVSSDGPGGGSLLLQLDDLTDVNVAAADPGDVLTRGVDGTWRGGSISYVHQQEAPVLTVQVNHGFGWNPAGLVCVDTTGVIVEPSSVSWPTVDIVEVDFERTFAGTITIS